VSPAPPDGRRPDPQRAGELIAAARELDQLAADIRAVGGVLEAYRTRLSPFTTAITGLLGGSATSIDTAMERGVQASTSRAAAAIGALAEAERQARRAADEARALARKEAQ
jgi:hypothetical protein